MNLKHLFSAILCFCLSVGFLSAQEICNNGIDDDNDGLIDLNDDDCECASFTPSSLIPNPSFEEMSCCPMQEAQLDCANEWIQASDATTDYVHECGILGLPFINAMAPLPFPDGEGAIGFRDGKPGSSNFKEYTGACLMEPLKSGQTYMLDFFIGFRDAPGSFRLDMAVFASMDCANLPFGSGNADFGCPTNGPGFVQLGEMSYNGINEWVNATFEFTPDQDYNVIVLGPACAVNPEFELDPYFFFDRLVLAELSDFGIPIVDIQGDACTEDLVLFSSEEVDGTYQWYKDGVAIIGENGPSLSIPNDGDRDGTYMVVVENADGCFAGEEYVVATSVTPLDLFEEICEGDSITVGGETFTETGGYAITIESNVVGCDTFVMLDLVVNESNESFIETTICAGETVIISGVEYNAAGSYVQSFTNEVGCDSIINIRIDPEPGCDDCQPRPVEMRVEVLITKRPNDLYELRTSEDNSITVNVEELRNFITLVSYEKEHNENAGLMRKLLTKKETFCLEDLNFIFDQQRNQSPHAMEEHLVANRILQTIHELDVNKTLKQTFSIK